MRQQGKEDLLKVSSNLVNFANPVCRNYSAERLVQCVHALVRYETGFASSKQGHVHSIQLSYSLYYIPQTNTRNI
jgi:hypothetical protein